MPIYTTPTYTYPVYTIPYSHHDDQLSVSIHDQSYLHHLYPHSHSRSNLHPHNPISVLAIDIIMIDLWSISTIVTMWHSEMASITIQSQSVTIYILITTHMLLSNPGRFPSDIHQHDDRFSICILMIDPNLYHHDRSYLHA